MKNYITHDSAENLHQSENLNQQAEPKEPPTVLWILCTAVNIWSGSKKFIKFALKAIAHWVRNFRMRFSVFSYSSSFPIKMNAMDAKTQKIEPDPNFCDGRKFRRQCVNVIVTMWGRIYFSTCEYFGRKFQTPCAETLKENATVFPYSNMFFPQLRRVDMYLSRLSPCT